MSASVFPARAGMSPNANVPVNLDEGVPRASGDEPALGQVIGALIGCSPRERG